jgi:glucose/arabinose dehydrogenase
VYLYWTCSAPPPADPFFPALFACSDPPGVGPDTNNILAVPLLGNRVDRFIWNGTTLVFDRNLIKLRAFQNDGAPVPPDQGDALQPPAGNHDGGAIAFGPDRKLYVVIGDAGRRGQLQNLPCGPTATCPGTSVPDDQFGGPAPDNAHLTGVVLRLNDDGTTPADNPFFAAGTAIGGEAGANVQRIFAYGIRNTFGIAFDPVSNALWAAEDGDDSFDELNRIAPGANGGWVQVAGPADRIAEYKLIETTTGGGTLQQLRWPPTNIANTPQDALSRLFMLPGASFTTPEFSWRYAVSPAAIGFVEGKGLGAQLDGDLFVGAATSATAGGYLFRFHFVGKNRKLVFHDARLDDRVADNFAKNDITESESLLIGRDFGIATDIRTGPNGNLFVVSLSHGAIYEIFRQ